MQLVELQRILPELERAGYALFAVSYDPVAVLAEFADRHSIVFPMLADEGSRVIDEVGVLDRDLAAHHEAMGTATRDDQQGVAYPVTFAIGSDGRVEGKTVEENYRLRDNGRRLVERLTGVSTPVAGVERETRRGVLHAQLQLDGSTYFTYQRQDLHVGLTVAPDWHVYGPVVPAGYTPLRVAIASKPSGVQAGNVDWPETTSLVIAGLEERFEVYRSRVDLVVPLDMIVRRGTGDLLLDVRIDFQACNEIKCLPPSTLIMSMAVPEAPVP